MNEGTLEYPESKPDATYSSCQMIKKNETWMDEKRVFEKLMQMPVYIC